VGLEKDGNLIAVALSQHEGKALHIRDLRQLWHVLEPAMPPILLHHSPLFTLQFLQANFFKTKDTGRDLIHTLEHRSGLLKLDN